MNNFRTLIVRFDSIINLQSFYDLEFKNLNKFNDRNIRLNYKKANINQLELLGYDKTSKFKSKTISQKTLNKMFKIIDQMPMRNSDKSKKISLGKYSICGFTGVNNTSHCFRDSTHQTCCMLGPEARKYSNESGNPIGTASEKSFFNYLNKDANNEDLTPWCTCIGSKVCSFYANKFNDGTHIKFINNKNKFLAYNFKSNCENKLSEIFDYSSHSTPGVNLTSKISNNCNFKKSYF